MRCFCTKYIYIYSFLFLLYVLYTCILLENDFMKNLRELYKLDLKNCMNNKL